MPTKFDAKRTPRKADAAEPAAWERALQATARGAREVDTLIPEYVGGCRWKQRANARARAEQEAMAARRAELDAWLARQRETFPDKTDAELLGLTDVPDRREKGGA